MATKDNAQTPAPLTADVLAEALATAMKEVQPPPKVTVATRKSNSPFNPTKRKLNCVLFQNGVRISSLTDVEIDLLNENHKKIVDGTYIDGLVKVTKVKRGSTPHLYVQYRDHNTNDRMKYAVKFGSLEMLLQKLIAESQAPKVVE
jgi:hypothetical protein